jgi:aquaporin related protein
MMAVRSTPPIITRNTTWIVPTRGQRTSSSPRIKVSCQHRKRDITTRPSKSDSCLAARTAHDGADERSEDIAARSEAFKSQRSTVPRQSVSSHDNIIPMSSNAHALPSQPTAVHQHGFDGHRSDSSIDHPGDRPRAKHTRSNMSRRPSASQYEMTSDASYRNGPSAESGGSSNS